MLRQYCSSKGAGVIVDVISEYPNTTLQVNHVNGSHTPKFGRSYVPVHARKAGVIDYPETADSGLKVWSKRINYHLNRGGIAHHAVRVMKTVRVMRRIVDNSGAPVPDATGINHAGKGVMEHDRIFMISPDKREC
jgi:hypothetical protein